jgi:hypothetical protein
MKVNLNCRFCGLPGIPRIEVPGGASLCRLLLFLLAVSQPGLIAEPFTSPSWGFKIDLPESYIYSDGDGRDRFSFTSAEGAFFDLVIYPGGGYESPQALAEDIRRRLGSRGDVDTFVYRSRKAAVLELSFVPAGGQPGKGAAQYYSGWGFFTELESPEGRPPPLLAALAYGPAGQGKTPALSALDSIAPAASDELAPGPMTEYAFPRKNARRVNLANTSAAAQIDETDAEAAQSVTDREFELLSAYAGGPKWKEAWIRFYRIIYRDAWDRLADAAFALERKWNQEASISAGRLLNGKKTGPEPEIAARALNWVQSFAYERDFLGSDFVNPVSAAVEGRGDCDSRALLWAVILGHANIRAGIMVSREYSHAMGLADIDGAGARFEAGGVKWLVAETTAQVSPGLIAAGKSDPAKWIGITF